jgi:hypothetical protein
MTKMVVELFFLCYHLKAARPQKQFLKRGMAIGNDGMAKGKI